MTDNQKTRPSTTNGNSMFKPVAKNRLVAQIAKQCRIPASKAKRYSNPKDLPVSTLNAGKVPLGFGQTRALSAIDTAIDIPATGYNIYAVGENGLGKRRFIQQYLKQITTNKLSIEKVRDWVYLYNFSNPYIPIACSIEFGEAEFLKLEIVSAWQSLRDKLQPLFFEHTQTSVEFLAIKQKFSDFAKQILDVKFKLLLERYTHHSVLHQHLCHIKSDMIANAYFIGCAGHNSYLLDASINTSAILTSRFCNLDPDKLPTCYDIILMREPITPNHTSFAVKTDNKSHTSNKFNNTSLPPYTPVIFESLPTAQRLFGSVTSYLNSEHSINYHINSGALHRANGGYLLIEAADLLNYPQAWQGLKNVLKTRQIDMSALQSIAYNCSVQKDNHLFIPSFNTNAALSLLKPEPIPSSVKVVLLGDEDTFDEFAELDSEFLSLFKIRADFHDTVERHIDSERAMVARMADIINKHQLSVFNAHAQALILEELSLQAEHQNKLSLHVDRLTQLLLEANRYAHLANANNTLYNTATDGTSSTKTVVKAKHVNQALQGMQNRSGYLRELYWHEVMDGQQLITTNGMAVGQINALTVIDYADSEFGMPARLTATVQRSIGGGDILDIERDVDLGGSLHAKGVLIMNSYLRALLSPHQPLNFTASLAFEQSYAHIDGDSATLAEACALLSALANVPISQSYAITGSMNQLGMVQAVGAINAKIVGFFEACEKQGLTGNQGVIIPRANVPQLMLRDDIIEAINNKQFHVFGVSTLSEALSLLTDIPTDNLNKKGNYHKSSLFGRILRNLEKWEAQLNPMDNSDNDSNED